MSNLDRDELLSAYLDGELAGEELAYVQRLLAEDPAYRRLEKGLREAQRRLGEIPREALGTEFHVGVLARLENGLKENSEPAIIPRSREASQTQSRYWGRPHDLRRMIGWPIVAAAAALLLLVSRRGAFEGQKPRVALAPPTTARGTLDADESIVGRALREGLGSTESLESGPTLANGTDRRATMTADAVARGMNAPAEPRPMLRSITESSAPELGEPVRAAGAGGYLVGQVEATADQLPTPEGPDASPTDEKRERAASAISGLESEALSEPKYYVWDAQMNQVAEDPNAAPVLVVNVDVPSLQDGMSALTTAFANNSIQVDHDADANESKISDLRVLVQAETQTVPFVVEDATVSQINGALTELQNNTRVVSNLLVVNDGTDVRSNAFWNRRVLENVRQQDLLALHDLAEGGAAVDAATSGGLGGGREAEIKLGIKAALEDKAARAYPADKLLDELSAGEQTASADLYAKENAVRGRRTMRLEELARKRPILGKNLVEVVPADRRLKAVFLLQSVEPAATPASQPAASPTTPEP